MIAPIESNRLEHVGDREPVVTETDSEMGFYGKPPIEPVSSRLADATTRLVSHHPGAAVTVAAAVGLFIGWIVKRKLSG